mmetsp:Transcript_4227/g.6239  ORF Transcript_4227/g.6239 Transcript_4227/m.6239 type:complete len:88 (-) Transcript_4227:2864-3127(-)
MVTVNREAEHHLKISNPRSAAKPQQETVNSYFQYKPPEAKGSGVKRVKSSRSNSSRKMSAKRLKDHLKRVLTTPSDLFTKKIDRFKE